MAASVKYLSATQRVLLALAGFVGVLAPTSALPEPINNSGLSSQECYGKDSGCTQFCGQVTGDMRYECFSVCDRMLDHCLDTGDWTDSARIDPNTGKPPFKAQQLSGFLLRMMMVLGDTDGDGTLSPKEIQSMKDRVFKGAATREDPKASAAPKPQ